jgi:HSP20 family molecular chaperone IbpA
MSALRDAFSDLPDAVFADFLESDDGYLLVVDLPGVTPDTLDVVARNGRVSIEARRAKDAPPEFRYEREDRSLFLDADLPLPPDADPENADAEMRQGVLELAIPKRSTTDETRIEIRDA